MWQISGNPKAVLAGVAAVACLSLLLVGSYGTSFQGSAELLVRLRVLLTQSICLSALLFAGGGAEADAQEDADKDVHIDISAVQHLGGIVQRRAEVQVCVYY